MPSKDQPRKGAKTKSEMIKHRNKSILITYEYLYHVKRKRSDDVMKDLVDIFFLGEDYIFYQIIPKTKLTEKDRETLKPILRLK